MSNGKQSDLTIECSLCQGQGGWQELVSREWETPQYVRSECWRCSGKGKISELQNAINIARGKVVPIPSGGYA